MASPFTLFTSSAVGPATPPCSPAANVGAGRHRVVRRSASLLSLDSIETFTLDEDDDELSGEDGGDDYDDDEDEFAQLAAARARPRSLPMVEEDEVDLRREKGMGGQAKLRVAIVTENFLPKVDGVTRTLARLLEHLESEGHEAILCGPETGMSHYASHPLVGTLGVPLVIYPGLKLNFLRPKFMREIDDFDPDVIHLVDPIWLGGQTLMGIELGWAGEKWVGAKGPGIGGGVRGAVVASYHTNLATYATLFGLPWLEPVIWVWQRWLYSKCKLYLCPSQSTQDMLASHALPHSRPWSRGVDLTHFNPARRSASLRRRWGIETVELPVFAKTTQSSMMLGSKSPLVVGGLVTPPMSPEFGAADASPSVGLSVTDSRLAVLYVGRVSWEKNLMLLLHAFVHLPSLLPPSTPVPVLVFVGDGPARLELEAFCGQNGIDAVFMGHQTGSDLAECYASADLFAFPSFTETFGQVVLEALASGLPVAGLDAEGTRDLVSSSTGTLLPLPQGARDWPMALKSTRSTFFLKASRDYAEILALLLVDEPRRRAMGERASRGTKGRTWHEAMEMCVSSYREAITLSKTESSPTFNPLARPIRARLGRVVRRLRGRKSRPVGGTSASNNALLHRKDAGRESETILRFKTFAKILITLSLLYVFYSKLSVTAPAAALSQAAVA